MILLRKFFVLLIVFVVSFSQTAFGFQFFDAEHVFAATPSSQKKLVAIIVDQSIYGSIKGDLERYTSSYIPKQATDIQALVFPVDTAGFKAADLQRILENLYLEGEKAKNSRLEGVMLFGNVPLPIIELNNKRQESIYPFVDFVDPMFVYDETKDVFVYNNHPDSLAELRHSVLPGSDPAMFAKFFEKLKQYSADPQKYAKAQIWIDDFPLLKTSYTEQERNDYINSLLFAEYDSYRRLNQAYNNILDQDNKDELVRVVSTATNEVQALQGEQSEAGEHPEVDSVASQQFSSSLNVLDRFNPSELVAGLQNSSKKPMPTLLLEKVIDSHFRPVHKMFGAKYIETMQKNPLAGGRYNLEDIDSSLEKIQLQDMISKQYLKDTNNFLEELLDYEIQKNKWPLKYPLPVLHQKWESLKDPELCSLETAENTSPGLLEDLYPDPTGTPLPLGPFAGSVVGVLKVGPDRFITRYLKEEYQNFYYGKNALVATGYHQLSPFRGTWLNIKDQLANQSSAIRGKLDDIPYDINKFSAGVGLGRLAQQTKMMRGFNFDFIYPELDLYDQTKCEDEQKQKEWAYDYWGGGSPFAIDTDALKSDPSDLRLDPEYSSVKQMRNPMYIQQAQTIQERIENRNLEARQHIGVGRKQFHPGGTVYQEEEITKQDLHTFAQKVFSRVTRIYVSTRAEHLYLTPQQLEEKFSKNLPKIHCKPRKELDDVPSLTSFEEVDYFRVYEKEQPKEKEKLTITVQPQLKNKDAHAREESNEEKKPDFYMPLSQNETGDSTMMSRLPQAYAQDLACMPLDAVNNDDIDADTLTNQEDPDMDGDGVEDEFDVDVDGDCVSNTLDTDIDGDGLENDRDADMDGDWWGNREDDDVDADGVANSNDDDIDGDGRKNFEDSDVDGDMMQNTDDSDIDGDGLINGSDPDIDGDGLINGSDPDIDGDGMLNAQDVDADADTFVADLDDDVDGDSLTNAQDDDIDSDGQKNADDTDIDGDGLFNQQDQFPYGWSSANQPNLSVFDQAGDGNTQLTGQDVCSGTPSDADGDGIQNKDDRDVDGDAVANALDPDVDGDGIMNRNDPDIDCDGVQNDADDDIDGDGLKNGTDKDNDCDGRRNGSDGNCGSCKKGSRQDTDKDNDGIPDAVDPDVDGDGLHNGYDDAESDTDGDGIPDEQDDDIDGDGIPNTDDPDIDGDQIGNWKKGDGNCNGCKGRCKKCGKQQDQDEDDDSDGVLDTEDPSFGGRDASLMNIEERKNACGGSGRSGESLGGEWYRRWRYYDYQIIDTVVQHKAPEVPHLDTGNVLTMERAIDDPRYTTFHGIGGDQVELIYPNLYKIPVYESCSLSKEEEIRKQVEQYLKQKAQHYNKLLQEQLQKAPSQYAQHRAAYDFVGAVDISATPNRSYELLPDDFFVQKLGELQIKRIATALYYLSLPWEEKRMGGGSVEAYIDDARKKHNLNKKFEYTMDQYLNLDTEKEEKEYKHDSIAYPTKIEKDYAYEVGLIVSDGQDPIVEKTATFPKAPTTVVATPTQVGGQNHPAYTKNNQTLQEEYAQCGVGTDGSVALLKWPKALQCRWKETVKKPVEFNLIIDIDVGDAKAQMEQWFKETQSDWQDLGGKTSWFVSHVVAQEEQRSYASYLRSIQSLNDEIIANLSPEQKSTLLQLQGGVSLGFENANLGIGAASTNLYLGAQDPIGSLRVSFRSVGDHCIVLAGKNLCEQTLQYSFDPYQDPQLYPITIDSKKAGGSVIIAKICRQDLCWYEQKTVIINPDQAAKTAITLPSETIVAGAMIPVQVSVLDAFDNRIDFLDKPLTLELAGATFPDGSTGKIIHNMQEAAFILLQTGSSEFMRLSASLGSTGTTTSTTIRVVKDASLDARVSGGGVSSSYRLPKKEDGFTLLDTEGKLRYNPGLLPTLDIALKDGQARHISGPVTIRSRKGYLSFGSLVSEKDADRFIHQDTLIVSGGSQSLRILPTGKAGDDEIIISSPGLQDRSIPFKILASGPDVIDMQLEGSTLPGQDTAIRITLKDSRGNLYTEPTPFELVDYGGLELSTTGLVISGAVAVVTGSIQKSGGSCGCGGRCRKSSSTPGLQNPSNGNNADGQNGNGANGSAQGEGDENGNDSGNSGEADDTDGENNGANGGENSDGSGNESPGGFNNDSAVCAGGSEQSSSTLPSDFTTEGFTTANLSFQAKELLRPSEWKPDDINVMYLNLWGGPWGDEAAVQNMLGNSKTLAITTMTNRLGGGSSRTIASLIRQDASIDDLQQVVDSMGFLGGELAIFLGTEGSIGSVSLGRLDTFQLIQGSGSLPATKEASIFYTPVSVPGITQNALIQNALYINKRKVIDFAVASIDTSIKILPFAEQTNVRKVMMNGLHIGSLQIHPGALATVSSQQVTLKDANYLASIAPGGGDSQSAAAILIQKTEKEGQQGEVALFPSIEQGSDPTMQLGFRHNFKNISNFAQGAMMGEATKHFANPYVINYGDPFLTRIKESRTIKETDFDEGVGRVIHSDAEAMIDVDSADIDNNGHKDIIITYRDGTMRVLKSYAGKNPYDDLGELLVPADGIKQSYIGDVNGDGLVDIMVHTTSDKLRVYQNKGGSFDVDGNIVCLDIPNGDKNVAQTRQLIVEDMDGNSTLDIITNDITNTIKVFYGGSSNGNANYVSTDGFVCDDQWKPRVQSAMQVVKKFSLTLGGPVKDGSLLHRPGLEIPHEHGEEQGYEAGDDDSPGAGINPDFDMDGKSKEEVKAFVDGISNKAMDTYQSVKKEDVADKNKNNIEYMEAAPTHLKADKDKNDMKYAVVRAHDPVENPGFEVVKQFIDLNGGDIEKGDKVRVAVSLIQKSSNGPIEYWEQLAGPRIIYKEEGGKIFDFNYGNIPQGTTIEWNVANGYEFRIDALPLGGTVNFSYDVQYDGNGFVRIEVETNIPGMYRQGTNRSPLGNLFGEAHAGGWTKKLRAYPDDGCYKQYWEFSPDEKVVPLQSWLDDETKKFQDTFEDRRVEKENTVREPDFGTYKQLMGILTGYVHNRYEQKKQEVIRGGIPNLSTNIDLDIGTRYLERFADEMEREVGQKVAQGVQGSFDRITKSLNWKQAADYEFTYEKCQGVKFGKKSCGYQAFPFNMAFLSPGSYNVFGCKPKVPVIPKFFPDDAGLPILAFPTDGTVIPVRPPIPSGAGGIFGGTTSQFRMYISPTLTNGLGLALCFGPYKVGMKMKAPVGDVIGNCLVIAGPLPGPQCVDPKDTQEQKVEEKEAEASSVLTDKHYDVAQFGVCDRKAQTSQPFVSPDLGGQIEVGGRPQAVQATFLEAGMEYMKGGNPFSLQIEGGNVKGLLNCIIRKWYDKQIRYVINNFTHMGVYITLPDIDQITQDIEQLRLMSEQEDLTLPNPGTSLQDAKDEVTKKQYKDREDWKKRVSIPKSVLYNANTAFENPFTKVAQMLDAIPLVSVYEKTVPIEIPRLYREDLNQYEQYLKAWLERNKEIVAGYGEAYKQGGNIAVTTDVNNALTMVRKNLQTIQEYKQFPSQLYQMIHIYDSYVTEVIDFINKLTSELTGWMQVNANRYSSYVDTLILMWGIIQSRQVLIDLSVNRQTKCGKCRQDNYDFYSCKLSLLCVDLPVLPIPPFRLPDIYIDLSRIKLGLDITLPKFAFVPKKVPTLRIPDLPEARDLELGLNISIPEIPELPRPPKLPDLPKLTLDLDMELPVLPPAPKIPNIVPSIKGVIKLADFIGTIWCTIKGGIGLVAEQGVKTRIEQMTQRKMNIDPFDSLRVTFPESPLEGYDYKLDATLDLKFDFQGLYDVFDGIAQYRNDTLDREIYTPAEEFIKEGNSWFPGMEKINNGVQHGGDYFEDILPKSGKIPGGSGSSLTVRDSQASGETIEAHEAKGLLQHALSFIMEDERYSHFHEQVLMIQSRLIRPVTVDHASEEVVRVLGYATDYLGRIQAVYRTQAQETKQRDRFLDSLSPDTFVESDTIKDPIVFSAPLFKTDDATKSLLKGQVSPTRSYLELNKVLVDGFHHALTTKTPTQLAMTPLQHEDKILFFSDLKQQLDSVLGSESRNAIEEKRPVDNVLLAQQGGGEAPKVTDIDFTQFMEGFFVIGKDTNYHNVMADIDYGKDMQKKSSYIIDDVNSDGSQDILSWTENAIQVKYGKQNDSHGGGGAYPSIEIGPFASMQALIDTVKESDGRYRAGGGEYKVYEPRPSLFDFQRYGHNYETISFSWKHDFSIPAYVVALTDTLGSQWEKLAQQNRLEDIQFVVVLPKDTILKDAKIEIPGYLPEGYIQDYIDQEKILRVIEFDGGVSQVHMRLENIPRQRNYARIASLKYENKNPGFVGGLLGKKDEPLLKKQSAWSLQHVAGTQKRGDDQVPSVDVKLIRVINGETKDQGFELKGNINTKYRIEADWVDNGKVIKSWIMRSGQVIKIEDGPDIDLEDLEYKFPTEEEFWYYGIDQAGNQGKEKIKLHIGVPEITIDEIRYQGASSEIESRLSDMIDKGKVQFERQRNGTREAMNPDQFPVKALDPLVIGTPYPLDDEIDIVDKNGNKRCSCNTKNCKITTGDNTMVRGSCKGGGKLKLEIIDTANGANEVLYAIEPIAESLVGNDPIQLLQGGYSLQTLNDESAGPYRFGTCVRKDGGDCVMFIDTVGNVYIPIEYQDTITADYAFDDTTESVIMTYRDGSALPIVKVNTKIKPFE